jgi:hypothetical protein
MIAPIVNILNGVRKTFINEEFFGLLRKTTQLVGHFIDGISYDLQKDGPAKQFYIVKYQYESYLKLIKEKEKDKIPAFKKEVLESLKINIQEEIKSMSDPLKRYLSKNGILKSVREKGKEVYQVSSKATASHIYSVLTSAASQFSESQTNLEVLSKIISSEVDNLKTTISSEIDLADKHIKKINEELEKKVDNITSIDGRVGSLVDGMLELFEEGSPHFQRLFDIGRTITRGVLVGAIKGATILFRILAGGTDVLATEMGLDVNIVDKLAKEKGIDPKKFTILDYMGVKREDMDSLVDELSGETTSLVSRLPTMFSMASSLIADLGSIFVEFGKGFGTAIASEVFDYVSSFNSIVQEMIFVPMGLDPEKLSKAKSASLLKDVVPSSKEDFDEIVNEGFKKGYIGYQGVFGNYLSLYENYKKSLDKNSPELKFLNSKQVKKVIKTLSDTSNYESSLNPLDDAEVYVRSSAIMSILLEAKKIKNANPINKNEQLKKSLLSVKEKIGDASSSKLESEFKDMTVEDVFQTARGYITGGKGGLFDLTPLRGVGGGESFLAEKRRLNELKAEFFKNNAQNVKDAEWINGKGIFIHTPQGIFKLDDNDSLYAAKEGGYWNKIFIKVSENFANFVSHIEEKVIDLEKKSTASFFDLTMNAERTLRNILGNMQNSKNVLTDIKIKLSSVIKNLSQESYSNMIRLQETIKEKTKVSNYTTNLLIKENEKAKIVIHEVSNLYESSVNTLLEEEEATYDDVMELIGLYSDIIQTISSKKPVVKKPKLAYYS